MLGYEPDKFWGMFEVRYNHLFEKGSSSKRGQLIQGKGVNSTFDLYIKKQESTEDNHT